MNSERWKGMARQWWKDQQRNRSPEDIVTPESVAAKRVRAMPCPYCAGEGVKNLPAPTAHHRPPQCQMCSGRGVVRVQLVVTLVDLPTGRVASKSIVPGAIAAQAAPDGGAVLDLAAVLRELSNDLDVGPIYRADLRELVPWDPDATWRIALRHDVDAEMTHEQRYEYEAAAIFQKALAGPHLIFYAGVDLTPRPSADESLERLVNLADDLQLDLVVDVRVEESQTLAWSVRMDFPGAAIVERPPARFKSLHQALRQTSVEGAMSWLRRSDVSAPARWLDPSSIGSAGRETSEPALSWADLSAKLTPLAVSSAGAVAVHRQGEWFLAALESATDSENGLQPVPALPEPLGVLIPTSTCAKCRGDRSSHCYRCADEGRMLNGVALTVTDLATRTKHVNWSVEGGRVEPAQSGSVRPETDDGPIDREPTDGEPLIRVPPSGIPLRQNEMVLDAYYSVAEQARAFGVPPHLLRDHYRATVLDRSLVDGRVTYSSSERQPSAYLQAAARNRPAGRLIVLARPEPDPPITNLFRTVIGLGLTLIVRVRTAKPPHRPPVVSWRIQLQASAETDLTRAESWFERAPSLPAAVAQLQAGLDSGLRHALEVGGHEPIPVPQQAEPVQIPDLNAIQPILDGLSEIFPNTDIWLGVNLTSWSCSIGRPHHRSVAANSIYGMLFGLMAPEVVEPHPEELRRIVLLLLNPDETTADALEAEVQGLPGRVRFGLAATGLLRCLLIERLGKEPDPAEIERYADEAYRDALENPDTGDGPPPSPAVYVRVITSLVDPSPSDLHQVVLTDHLSVVTQILVRQAENRRKTNADFDGIIDQAVEAGILVARTVVRTVTGSVERHE